MHIRICIYIHIYTSSDAQIQGINARGADLHESTLHRVCLDSYVRVYRYTYTYMYVYIYIYMCIFIMIYIHEQ